VKRVLAFFNKWTVVLLAFVKPLGVWGAFAVALIDASSIPLPMDIIIAGYAWADRWHFYVYAILAGAGSAVGALVPYLIGRAGGELFLLRRINRERFERLRDRFERQEFLALLLPSMMPPPTPWKLFVFGAGVFEMKVPQFMLAIFLGRMVRYFVEGALTILYGPKIMVVFGNLVRRHALVLVIVSCVLIGLVVWVAVRAGRKKKPEAGSEA
jgi:membrane protein YqaA with SNARE-associated domain